MKIKMFVVFDYLVSYVMPFLLVAITILAVAVAVAGVRDLNEIRNEPPELVNQLPTFSDESLAGLQTLSEYSGEQRVENLIRGMAREYGVSEDVALAIAQCESGLDPYAMNPISSAKGVYQFTDGTWDYIRAQGHQFDAEENIKQFMIWYQIHPNWWVCE